jgi:signal recognition particle subunit SRP19
LKDYDGQIIWLDYFNKNLTRKKGRKVSKDNSIFDPTMDELMGAAKSLGLEFPDENINLRARYPRRSFVKSGYVMITKLEKKSEILNKIAKKMRDNRTSWKKPSA